ncbi:hypothetical protein E2562_000344 [Oryza meyeriana var. granulata]|uniref:Pentacotripeptide-repeat region of PRORP domain-containing protein n=1 Tax=Oryza meyeriana var. granulata TaxID=110450 RepID=A0A6G1CBN8_9ORYZ|nr:hypothetical protein E2562_000344 [Oryza meyeriana var. granulata]
MSAAAAAATDVNSRWTLAIRAAADQGRPRRAVALYLSSLRSARPCPFALAAVLKSVSRLPAAPPLLSAAAASLHGHLLRLGLLSHPYPRVALAHLYARLPDPSHAHSLLDETTSPARPQTHSLLVSRNSLLASLLRSGDLAAASALFDRMRVRDVVSWNSMVAGLAKAGHLDAAIELFDKMPERNAASWNAVMCGYIAQGNLAKARELFEQMPVRSNVSWITMISGYAKSGDVHAAGELFERMENKKDLYAWNAMIACYAQNGCAREALAAFNRMLKPHVWVMPNEKTFSSVISACSQLGDLRFGLWAESFMGSVGIELDDHLRTALVDLHTKNGQIDRAFDLFRGLGRRDVVSYSAMIVGCGMNGMFKEAVNLFKEMCYAKLGRFIQGSPENLSIDQDIRNCSGGARISLPPPPAAPAESRDEPEQEEGSLAQRVERAASVCAAIRGWMGGGRAVHRGHIFHAVNRLRRRRLHRTALQVMEWIMRERPYKLSELDYSYLLEFTAKVHGIAEAESLFLRIPQEYQNELLYNNLVMACLDLGLIKLAYGRQKTISKILIQMKADGVTPHTSTYNILLKIKANEHNIDGVARVFNDMKRAKIEPNEITFGILAIAHAVARLYTVSQTYVEAIENSMTGTNWSTLEILLILYGYHECMTKIARILDPLQLSSQILDPLQLTTVQFFYMQMTERETAEAKLAMIKLKKTVTVGDCRLAPNCLQALPLSLPCRLEDHVFLDHTFASCFLQFPTKDASICQVPPLCCCCWHSWHHSMSE